MEDNKDIAIRGRRWDSVEVVSFEAKEGQSLEEIVLSSIKYSYTHYNYSETQYKSLLRYARCKLNGKEKPREMWAHIYPKKGSLIEIFHGVRGGGGNGGIMGIIQVVVGAVLAVVGYAFGWTGIGAVIGNLGVGLIITGLMTTASSLLFPTASPSMGSFAMGGLGSGAEPEKYSPTYSISGAKNKANVNGYVPLVLGKHRHYPPLGGRSWTSWEGDLQYFHMLVVWGHPDVVVSDFKIGDTPLDNYKNVDHVFHQESTGNDLIYFSNSYQEESVEAVLKQSEGWNTRVVGEAEAISLDFAFLKGLVSINKNNGNYNNRTVSIQVQFREVGTEQWLNFGEKPPRAYTGGTVSGTAQVYVYAVRNGETGTYSVAVGASRGGDLQIWPSKSSGVSGCSVSFGVSGANVVVSVASGSYNGVSISGRSFTIAPPNFKVFLNDDGSLSANSGDSQIIPTPSGMTAASMTVDSYDGSEISVTVADGWYGSTGIYSFTANSGDRVVRNIRMEGLTKAVYEVQCERTTADSTSNYVRDECTWYVMRAITNIPVFATPMPICVSELRIRAGEQLSGYVEEFNAMCHSKVPNWNGTNWVSETTSNPASLMRYVLTSEHCLAKPYTENRLDGSKLVEFWNYCNDNDYQFNYICDSEESLWERLVHITAPGRGAPTTDVDGKWGVVMDNSGKTPIQMFTPRNSWGMSIQRDYAKIPDALRVSFIDETDGYVTKEGFVFNDGFSNDYEDETTQSPQDVVEWDFPGITKWEKVYTQGRLYLARTLHRQMTITINTDWEWIACHRGDLVGVASDVLMNTFGTARISGLLYDVDGQNIIVAREEDKPVDLVPIGLRLDNSVLFSELYPARYGIAIRYNTGQLYTYEIAPEYNEECDVLRFANPITAAQIPPLGAIVSVSLLGEEYDEYLVAKITPSDKMVAQITLIPYKIEEIEEAISKPIPPYSETVILDIVRGASLPPPIILQVKSDESVLGGYTGNSIPRIAAWWGLPNMSQNTSLLRFQLRARDVETGKSFYANAYENEEYVAVEGVEEGCTYDLTLRMMNPVTGITSSWSSSVRHTCIGRTTPPPPPDAVILDGSVLRIFQDKRPQDVVGHVVFMVFDEDDPIDYALKLTNPYTNTGTFDLAPWSGYARRAFIRTIDEIGLLSDPVSVAINLIDRETRNVLFTIKEKERNWSGEITNGIVDDDILYALDRSGLWAENGEDSLWQAIVNDPLWNTGDAMRMTYIYDVTIDMAYAGASFSVVPQEISGKLLSIEYRASFDKNMWGDNGTPLWSVEDQDLIWGNPTFGDWTPLQSNYVLRGGESIQIKVIYDGGDIQAALSDIWTIIDVSDLEWAVEDIEISADGTHIPIPEDYFRAITNVVATLQYRQGDTGVTAVRMPGSETMGDNGYLTDGPVIKVLDASRNATVGSLDVRLKGY